MHTSVCLVAAGMGVSIVPAIMQTMQTKGVMYRRLADVQPSVSFMLAWRDGEISPLRAAFFTAAREAAVGVRNGNPCLQLETQAD